MNVLRPIILATEWLVTVPCMAQAARPANTLASYRFDANIVNNSLAVSLDERIAVASISTETGVQVVSLKTGKRIQTLKGFVSPRNILFTPDGKTLLISDSTRGVVAVLDARSYMTLTSTQGRVCFETDPRLQ
jgi:DNA-binding beta-propeller fold protein YncE